MTSASDPFMGVEAPNATMRSPRDDIDTAHRRIDLQSPADLSYLLNNVRRAARSKIDLHLPLEAALREGTTGVDEMRAKVEDRVNSYIENTFEMAKKSISVNSVDAENVAWEKEVPEEFEPYDHELANRIAAMHSTIESLHLSLANTRREAAALAAQNFQSKFTAQSEQIDTSLRQLDDEAKRATNAHDHDLLKDVRLGFEDREEEVSKVWQDTLSSLEGLQNGLGETREKAEGAIKVVSYLEGKA